MKYNQYLIDNFNPHAHSDGSNLRLKDSITKVEKLVEVAIEKGHCGVSLTDHETVSLHIEMMKYVQKIKEDKKKLSKLKEEFKGKKLKKEIGNSKISNISLLEKMSDDFTLVLGNEIYLVNSLEEVKDNYKSGETKFPHYLLLAKDKVGHKQIRELSSLAWKESFYTGQMERVPTLKSNLKKIVTENKGHLIASTACVGGEFLILVGNLIEVEKENDLELINNIKLKIHKFIQFNLELFEKDFYIEIQPTIDEFLWEVNKRAIEIAEAYKINTIISTDTHYHTQKMRSVHESFLKSKEGERELEDFYATTYTMDVIELWEYFEPHVSYEWFLNTMENTVSILNKIEDYTLAHDVIIPEIEIIKAEPRNIFKKWYSKAPYIEKFSKSEHLQDRYFLTLIEHGFENKFQEFNEENIMRINIELLELWEISIKLKQRMSAYYNLVEYIVDLMWDDKRGNSFVGIARGSVTGFYTCFLVGITQMNPIKWNLPHWRHISAERPDMPDIDLDSEAAKRQNIFTACKEDFGYDNVLNITTFKTEGSKSSALSACRGFGINNDIAQNISDMIPFERGSSWTLEDCFHGNEKENREPIKQFIELVEQFDGLKETMLAISGLIVGRSIHASGVYIFKRGYLEQNALMKAPNGNRTTQWNMKDSDWAGGLKVDFLTIEAEDKIRVCSEFLLEFKKIQWNSNWRKTYDDFLHPDKINYTNQEMWSKVADNKIDSLFQYVTPIGLATARALQPTSLQHLMDGNSLMRLMKPEDALESPVETYIKFKENISLWYDELKQWKLTKEEIQTLEPHLLPVCGVASTQEDIMEISMNSKISGFNVALSNKLRKCIAKKNKKAQEDMKETFFSEGKKIGTSINLLKYVWYVQILRQIGYSFSRNHTAPYSNIAVQEMNLAHFYNPIFWNCACLSVDSGAVEDFSNYGKVDSKDKTTNYGKMANAIGKMRQRNVNVSLPHINETRFKFYPNEETDEIIFGLKGIVGVGDDVAHDIINHRPYISLLDFHQRLVEIKREVELSSGKIQNKSIVSSSTTISLIKAGAFDKIENKPREKIMKNYLESLYPPKKSMSIRGLEQVKDLGIIPEAHSLAVRVYNFRIFLTSKDKFVKISENAKSKKWQKLIGINDAQTEKIIHFFNNHFMSEMHEEKDYYYNQDGDIIVLTGGSSSFEKQYKEKVSDLKKWLNSSDCLDRYNQHKWDEVWNKYASGTISKWEMDSLSFYYHEHELANANNNKYGIESFEQMKDSNDYTDKEKNSFRFSMYKGTKYPQYPLSRICGTVLDKNKDKHSLSILTPDGVVLVKYYAGAFSHYNKQISVINEDDSKTVVEKSWFSRGTKLLITGYRRGDQFKPKVYRGNVYQHTTCLIEKIRDDGILELKTERTRV